MDMQDERLRAFFKTACWSQNSQRWCPWKIPLRQGSIHKEPVKVKTNNLHDELRKVLSPAIQIIQD